MEVWRRLIEYWRSCELVVPPGVDPAAIRAFESRYRVTLPGDLLTYFSAADGSGDRMDDDLIRFWPLGEVKPVHEVWSDIDPARYAYPGCYLLADHFMSGWDYAVRIVGGEGASGPVFRVTGQLPVGEPIAASFVEFIEMYLADPSSIL